ncbi:MAG: 16S rRNA (cytosine(1402)-N(4))-methyltransferase RsmH [Microgenomates group bacterium]
MDEVKYHESVMVREVLENLGLKRAPLKNQVRVIDATLGTGGHSLAIIKIGGRVLGIDLDEEILEIAKKRLEKACPALEKDRAPFKLVNGNFKDIDKIAEGAGFKKVDGVVFDLGVSNIHLKSSSRGFSFENETAPLDARLNPKLQAVTAADLLNSLRKDQLESLFNTVMTKGKSKKLAIEVVIARGEELIKNVGDFLKIINKAKIAGGKLHPGTLPFLALRIAVNSELENLKIALPKAFELLKKGGRLVVISFHSGEDKLVKNFFRDMEKKDLGSVLTKKPLTSTSVEINRNPRARSAKLRCLEKVI